MSNKYFLKTLTDDVGCSPLDFWDFPQQSHLLLYNIVGIISLYIIYILNNIAIMYSALPPHM